MTPQAAPSSSPAAVTRRHALGLLGAGLLAGSLGGCASLLIGGAVGGALVATDRRTSGTVVEDQALEIKAGPRIREAIGDRGHINVTSYNRIVLITGEAPTEADKAAVGAAVARLDNVRGVLNELAVAPKVSLAEISNDAVLTSKVKASFVDARDIFANAIKVVTEHGVVFLMGLVTEREANRATEVARSVGGVRKVVRAFEIITEDELAKIRATSKPAPK